MRKLISRPARKAPCRPLLMAASAQKIGMLLPHRTKLNGMAKVSSGGSMPLGGHCLEDALRKK